MIDDASRRLSYMVEGDSTNTVCRVVVPIGTNVVYLKGLLYDNRKGYLHNFGPGDLVLWKLNEPVLIEPEHNIITRIVQVRGNDLSRFAVELGSGAKVLDIFPERVSDEHVHIIAQVLPEGPYVLPAWPFRKHSLEELSLNEDRKKRRRGILSITLPSEADITALHTRIREISADADWYSNPGNMDSLPFPLAYTMLPIDRFCLSLPPASAFQYMGRECFSELWKHIQSMRIGGGYSKLYFQGTMGNGKSHILAALAQALAEPLSYIQSALLCAFADPESSSIRDEIRSLESTDDVLDFCNGLVNVQLFFIVDQKNALEHEDTNRDTIPNSDKDALAKLIRRMAIYHYSVSCASTNYGTVIMAKKETSELNMSMIGGLSKSGGDKTMVAPSSDQFEDEVDRMKVEDLTGCIPLLLGPFLECGGKDFRTVEKVIWKHRDLVAVGVNVRDFAKKRSDQSPIMYEDYLLATFLCLTRSGTRIHFVSKESFDYRYFYANDEEFGNYTCGLARDAAALLLRQAKPSEFLDNQWLSSFSLFKGNPSVLGSMVEQSCLSAISSFGFNQGTVHWKPTPSTLFEGDLIHRLPPRGNDCSIFFVPDDPYYKDIDALYLRVKHKPTKTVLVVPIQITIAKRHKDSEMLFYLNWARWQAFYDGYAMTTTFVWIVEDQQSWEEVMAKFRKTRSTLHMTMPQHQQAYVPVQEVYRPLGETLARIRRTALALPSSVYPSTPEGKIDDIGESDGGERVPGESQLANLGGPSVDANYGMGGEWAEKGKNVDRKGKGRAAVENEAGSSPKLRRSTRLVTQKVAK